MSFSSSTSSINLYKQKYLLYRQKNCQTLMLPFNLTPILSSLPRLLLLLLFGPYLFSPQPSWPPDPLHAYLGLCGLSLIGEPTLRKVHAALNITQRAFQHLQQLQQTWKDRTDSCGRQQWRRERRPLCARAAPAASQSEATGISGPLSDRPLF